MIFDYVFVFLVVFFLNLLPAFAPPTWAVLSYFKIKNPSLDTLLLVLVGVVASTLGRYGLYLYSSFFGNKIPYEKRKKLSYLRRLIEENGPFVGSFIYALGPFPSNLLFIITGVVKASPFPIFLGFFFGRLISYFSLVYISSKFFSTYFSVFEEHRLLLDLIFFVAAVLLIFVDWERVYKSVQEFKRTYFK